MKHQIKNSLAAAFFFLCLTTRINALGAGAQIGGIPGLLINQNEIKLENISINLTGTFRMERFPLTV